MVVVSTRKVRKPPRKIIILRASGKDLVERRCACISHSSPSAWGWKEIAVGLLAFLGREITGSLADTLGEVIRAVLGN